MGNLCSTTEKQKIDEEYDAKLNRRRGPTKWPAPHFRMEASEDDDRVERELDIEDYRAGLHEAPLPRRSFVSPRACKIPQVIVEGW